MKTVLSNMIDDLLSIVVDPFIPPLNEDFRKGRENLFELIYSKEGRINIHRGHKKDLLYLKNVKEFKKEFEKIEKPERQEKLERNKKIEKAYFILSPVTNLDKCKSFLSLYIIYINML